MHSISRIQCYVWCSIFSGIMLTNREQQEGNGVNQLSCENPLSTVLDGFQMTVEKQEQSA